MCDKKKFVQVHCHSDNSLLDGAASVDKLIKRAKEFGHPALALTNHGNPSDLYTFAKQCKKEGIKPILGLEFYICNDLRSRVSHKERETMEDRDYHQSIYIKDKEGYLNFNYLTYQSFTEGYYYKPRIDFDLLFERKKGLMITSSCMASKTSNYIRLNQHKDAEDLFKKYLKEFGDDFYGEIQFNEVGGQKQINDFIIHVCKKYDVPLLIGGDVHYLNPEDNLLQDALIRSKRDNENSDWTISARKLYFHDTGDYMQFNKDLGWNYDERLLEECFENSIKFSDKANFEFETGTYHFPKINTEGIDSNEYLRKLVYDGAIKKIATRRKYGEEISNELIDQYTERIEYELSVIKKMGVSDYFLMVHDIIDWEKTNGYYVGPGRGSVAGACTAYFLDISSLCPIKHNLLFERFINPERKVAPDIDWDSSEGARDAVLQYLIGKYGQESVCNVPTFGTFGAKSALQSMSRGLRKDTAQDSVLMRKITKLPEIEDTKTDIPDLVAYFKKVRARSSDQDVISWIDNNQDVIDFAQRIQGQMTQLGVHAGGVVITPKPIYNYVPVTRGSGNLVTAFREADGSSKDLGELGIIKFDILGLSTLNIFKYCVDHIMKDKGIDLSEKIWYLDLEDQTLFEYFMNESPYGIFQMERGKMLTSQINVDSFDDIEALNALNRPGPLEKYLKKYGYWKDIDKGNITVSKEELEEIDKERYPFPFMRKVLSPTYGCLLYQEQFMLLVKEAAGFDMGEADNFRRGIAWTPDNPKYHTVEKYFQKLESGMIDKGYKKEDVGFFVKYCRDFLGYSFNSSHSCLLGNTIIKTKDGDVKIEDVAVGEMVLCFNEVTKENEYCRINNFFDQGIKQCYQIITESGKVLEATPDHLILSKKGVYHKLQDCISKRLAIRTKDGFEKIKTFKSLGEHHVYDIEIDSEFHNFYANDIVVHNCVYSYITYQTLYFKKYYPAYFYAGMINNTNDADKIQAIFSDAKDYPISILPHSIIKSTYETKVENDTTIRLGYGMIKGMGTAVEEEIRDLSLHECSTLGEVLQKPFKKINSTQFESLIDIGAFDEFNLDRNVIRLLHSLYSDPKIEQWFTRKKQPLRLETIPSTLNKNFDEKDCLKIAMKVKNEQEPWKLLISELIQQVKLEALDTKKYLKETTKKQKELLGFSLGTESRIAELSSSFKAIGVLPLSEFENENKDYFFLIEKITIANTKTGKRFLQLVLNDGKQTMKAKCWRELELKEDEVYRGRFKKDSYGFTLNDKGLVKV